MSPLNREECFTAKETFKCENLLDRRLLYYFAANGKGKVTRKQAREPSCLFRTCSHFDGCHVFEICLAIEPKLSYTGCLTRCVETVQF